MNKLPWIIATFLSGALLPIQAGLNTRLGKAISGPLYASLFSFVAGTLALTLYILLTGQTVSWQGIKNAPLHLWLGGLMGAFYITIMIFAFPVLGPGLTFGLVVAGQMLMSVALEHYHVLVAQPNPVSWMKILGVVLVVTGVILIRKF